MSRQPASRAKRAILAIGVLAATAAACSSDSPDTTISPDNDVITAINVLTPDPDDQERVVSLLEEGITDISQQPGFVSASIHQSFDSPKIVVYAQWEDQAAFDGIVEYITNGGAPAQGEAFAIGNPEFHLYDVVQTTQTD